MSGASEQANGRANGPVLTSGFLIVLDHSAAARWVGCVWGARACMHGVRVSAHGRGHALMVHPRAISGHSVRVMVSVFVIRSVRECEAFFVGILT